MIGFNLKYLSEYRTPLMGIAALMIVICHAPAYGVSMPAVVAKIVASGGLGVDVFLFLSGIGCYYSLSKLGTRSVGSWYKRRLVRIFIPYALMQIPFWTYELCVGSFDLIDSIYTFSTVKFWVVHRGAWYVALLLPLYIITPLLYKLLQKSGPKRIYVTILIMLFIILICFMDFEHMRKDYVVDNLRWAFKRTTNFVVGMAIAPYVKQEKRVNVVLVLGVCLLSFFLVHRCISKELFMDWCKVPYLVMPSVLVLKYMNRNGFLYRFVCWMGIVSLESYLANIYLCGAVSDFAKRTGWNDYGCYAEYLVVIVLGVTISWGIHKMSGLISNKNAVNR